jgi:2-methylisocitrate lyase-like PEP mutase family enzyme
MFHPDAPAAGTLAASGVARISYGPRPYRDMVAWLTASARAALRGGAS